MKIVKQTISILVIALALYACSSDKKAKANFLPPITIEIPAVLSDNKDAVALIESSEKALNEFSNNIETLIVDNEDIWNKPSEDLSMMEQLTLAKTLVQFAANSAEMVPVMEKLNNLDGQEVFNELNEEQVKAMEEISKVFIKRIDEINAKYQHLAKK